MYRGARPSQVPQGPIQLMPASFDHWPPAYCHDRHRDGVSTAVETMLCMSPDQRLIHQGWYASAPKCQTYSSRNNAELSVGRIPPWSHLVNTGLTGPFYSETHTLGVDLLPLTTGPWPAPLPDGLWSMRSSAERVHIVSYESWNWLCTKHSTLHIKDVERVGPWLWKPPEASGLMEG